MKNPFKVGDMVKCIRGSGKYLKQGNIYTITSRNDDYVGVDVGVEDEDEDDPGWEYSRFVLFNRVPTISFEVWEWSEWVEDIVNRIKGEIKYDLEGGAVNEITVDNLIHAPKLDLENPQPFCQSFMFDGIYENNIFVRHCNDKNSFWFISGGDTCLIYKPKMIKIEV